MAADPVNPNALAASRLPDLPDAGYATRRQQATSDLVMVWLRTIERNRLLLLTIVVDGSAKWRKVAGNAWHLNRAGRSTAMTTDLLNAVWDYMVRLAGPNPHQQLLILEGQTRQQQQAQWDKRPGSAAAWDSAIRHALAEAKAEQARLKGRRTLS